VADLQRSLQLLAEINREQSSQRREKDKVKRDADRTVRIDLVSDTSKSSVYASNENDLVTLLQNAKLRSA